MRRPGRLASIALAIAPVVLAAGCPRPPPAQRPYAAPSADELVALLDARATAVRSMNTRARATSWLSGERVRATVLMLVARDGHLRFEAEVSLQGTVATLATDGETFSLLDAQKNELSRGPACPANVASLIRIPLAPAEIAAILLGDARRAPSAKVSPSVGWDPTRGADVLELVAPGETLHVFFQRGEAAGASVDIVGVEALAGSRRRWLTSYEDIKPVGAGAARLPETIRFSEGMDTFDEGVQIKVKDRTLNEPLPADRFVLTAPPGVTVKAVGCGG